VSGEPLIQANAMTEGQSASTADVLHKQRSGWVPLPYAEISGLELMVTGFRQSMLDLSEGDERVGSVDVGAGLGSDFITLRWGERLALVRGIDLLRAWVQTIDAEGAKRLPEGLK
jgi:hypothetical protein